MAGKSLVVAYLLWIFAGWFGAHHFYLGRDRQAFLWFATLGCYFGCGWFRDLWWIPTYVREANHDQRFVSHLVDQMQKNPDKPPFNWSMFFGAVTVGNGLGYLWSAAVPEELVFGWNLGALSYLLPVAVAIGVHGVGNMSSQEGDLMWPLIGAYVGYPLVYFYETTVFWCSFVSAAFFEWKSKKWRRRVTKPKSCVKRFGVLFMCAVLYFSLWASYAYFNAEITDKDGERIKLRDSVNNFLRSPMWNEFVETLTQVYHYWHAHGWRKMWEEVVEKLDPHGEQNALKVLNLTANASQEEIRSQYRLLSKEWHPDRHKDPEAKKEAAQHFMEIQQAYERLSNLKSRRLKRNKATQ